MLLHSNFSGAQHRSQGPVPIRPQPGSIDFRGVWCPLITPFRDGEVDHTALRSLVNDLIRANVDGLVAASDAGEIMGLSSRERLEIGETVLDATAGRVPVLLGIAPGDATATRHDVSRLNLPVAGYLVPVPATPGPNRNRLFNHLTSATDATEKPIVLYDRSSKSGEGLTPELLQRLYHTKRFPAVILDGKAIENLSPMIESDGPAILTGNAAWFYITMQLGGQGCMLPMANALPEALHRIYALFCEGRLEAAWNLYVALGDLKACFAGPTQISALKCVITMRLGCTEEVRWPEPMIDLHQRLRIRAEIKHWQTGQKKP